jgi:N-acyl homoserine lactone hydrolase
MALHVIKNERSFYLVFRMITITAIETGNARMKAAQQTGRNGRSAIGRKLDIFRDRNWVGPLPILSFLIEHPEGRFLVDTGDTWRNSVPGYLPWWNPFFTKEVVIKVAPLEEIGPRLQAMKIDPARNIAAVILTHFHHDHTGGLDHFPHNRIIAPRESYEDSRGLKGMFMGCLPQRWPIWFKPELVDMDGPSVGPFPASHPITRDGRIVLVPTPGHAKGHVSVIVRDDDVTYFLAGDATYNEANLRNEKADGVTNDPVLSIETLRRIKRFALDEPTIILPAHDPDGPARLAERRVYR